MWSTLSYNHFRYLSLFFFHSRPPSFLRGYCMVRLRPPLLTHCLFLTSFCTDLVSVGTDRSDFADKGLWDTEGDVPICR